MRHRKQGRGLGRNPTHRKAMLANLATAVLEREKVKTTTAKAKEARSVVERLITVAKKGDLHARRQVLKTVRDRTVVAKLFDTIAPRFSDRPGGYTRIIHVGQRQGDAAEISILELVDNVAVDEVEQTVEPESKPKRKRTRKAAAPAPVAEEPAVEEAVVEEIADTPEEVDATPEANDEKDNGEAEAAEASAAETAGDAEGGDTKPEEPDKKKKS